MDLALKLLRLPLYCRAATAATAAKLLPRAATAAKLPAATELPLPPLRCRAVAAAKLPTTAKLPSSQDPI